MNKDNHHFHDHKKSDGHGQTRGHHHDISSANFRVAFVLGTAFNIGLVVLQVAYGIVGNSVALLADAGHNLSDVSGLLIAWGASRLARRPPSARYTYGLRSTSILAALGNAIILLVVTGGIAWEAVQRFGTPEPVAGNIMMAVSAVGIIVNGGTAFLFMSGREGDLNIRGVFLHMAADAGISLGVLMSGMVILLTGWLWFDPLTSLIISAIIVWGTWGLFRDSVNMSLNAVPVGINSDKVRRRLQLQAGVVGVHDLHIWPMSTTETALTCHLVMPEGHPGDAFIAKVAQELRNEFGISHTTIQIERGDADVCDLEPDHIV
jgi:cobalt-zinc-cadmium efflux system protein